MLTVFLVLASLFALWRIGRRTRYFLHVLQLEGYKPHEYAAWLGARTDSHVLRRSHLAGLILIVLGWAAAFAGWPRLGAGLAAGLWSVAFASSKLYRSERPKKALAWTARMKRLATAAGVLAAVPVLIGAAAGWRDGAPGALTYLSGLLVADFFAPYVVYLAGLLMKPVEASVQEGYKAQARRTLENRPDLTVVAITGSYGKTSTKFIIAELLGQRFNVLATPSSYNTPMGICLVVNNKLRSDHQVLVVEMGMRYPGDIQELCEIARPDVAVVTSVGMAHLETMGSIEAIAKEKGSLLRYMKPGGTAILNGDDERVRDMHGVEGRVLRVSLSGTGDITGRDVRYGPEGMSLTVRDEATGEEAMLTTPLLGAHNALNLLLGVAVARALGLRLRAIAQAAGRIKPVEHRLALRQEQGVTILDDAFNSNPVGAQSAVEVLGQFKTGRRVIVTPGMVELGERQHAENFALGEHIARHVDLAVLVGPKQT
ncbi:MAG TPA: UDP-N-acetylmuramoyl-tripeptide--D-alanyl-D-alanine ligase, partial [Rhodothermales bacterium]|nr:UDP-N-acetylmuramoyl-tripeptide--D-alanyl-D-alanine ligase [Rhodothermales bacterium]